MDLMLEPSGRQKPKWRQREDATMLSSTQRLAAAFVLAICLAPSTLFAQVRAAPKVELVILGAAAGRTSYGGHPDGGFAAAVVVGDDRYVVDFGRGWHDRYYQAGLGTAKAGTGFAGLETLRAAFITHLHADHVVGYPELLLFGATEGLRRRTVPLQVFGPGSRGAAPPESARLPAGRGVVNPSSPSPGTVEMTERLYEAFAADLNDNILDSGMPNPHQYIQVHDVALPADIVQARGGMPPRMSPFEVYRDEQVRVTATLVAHPPMYPAFAYRFDTPAGAVVFSGDTNKSDNLIELAKGASVLVHEVISRPWADALFPLPRSPDQEAKLDHLMKSHTDVSDVGEVATRAGVKRLVLSHLAPPTVSSREWVEAVRGYDGVVEVGRPLHRVTLSQ